MSDGYQFFADRKLVTIFSAPNYCGLFDNDAAIMEIDSSLCCKFRIFKMNNINEKSNNRRRMQISGRALTPFKSRY